MNVINKKCRQKSNDVCYFLRLEVTICTITSVNVITFFVVINIYIFYYHSRVSYQIYRIAIFVIVLFFHEILKDKIICPYTTIKYFIVSKQLTPQKSANRKYIYNRKKHDTRPCYIHSRMLRNQ